MKVIIIGLLVIARLVIMSTNILVIRTLIFSNVYAKCVGNHYSYKTKILVLVTTFFLFYHRTRASYIATTYIALYRLNLVKSVLLPTLKLQKPLLSTLFRSLTNQA